MQHTHGALQSFFASWARLLVRYTLLFLILPLLATAFLLPGFLVLGRHNIYNSSLFYTPTDARYYEEKATLWRHWPLHHDRFSLEHGVHQFQNYLYVFLLANPRNASLIDPPYLGAVADLEHCLGDLLTVRPGCRGPGLRYQDVCLSYDGECQRSGSSFLALLRNRETLARMGLPLTYPKFNEAGNSVLLQDFISDVTLDKGVLEAAGVLRLVFVLRSESGYRHLSEAWEHAAGRLLEDVLKRRRPPTNNTHIYRNLSLDGCPLPPQCSSSLDANNLLSGAWLHSRSFDEGMAENTIVLLPKVTVTFMVLAMFAVMVSTRVKFRTGGWRPSIDLVESKPWWAGAGILTAAMGIISGMGLPLLLGGIFTETSTVIPFLIISIGVDDMFILTAAWHHSRRLVTKGGTVSERVEARMVETMSEAAVAITITSVTDSLSFAVGTITKIPAVAFFCRDAALSCAFNYLYQITFFAAIMVIGGRAEEERRNCLAPCHIIPEPSCSELKSITMKEKPSFFRRTIGPLIVSPWTALVTIVIYLAYLGGAVYGIANLKEGLKYEKLLLSTNPVQDVIVYDKEYFSGGSQADVVVSNPPDLSDPILRNKTLRMIEEFEASPWVDENEGTHAWIRAYLDYLWKTGSRLEDTRSQWVEGVFEFSTRFAFRKLWEQDLAWEMRPFGNASRLHLKAYRFHVTLPHYKDPQDQRATVRALRALCDSYPEWEMSVYGRLWEFTDQFDIIKPNTLQNIGIALLCMIVVSLVLIPNPICTLWITLAIISIDVGVVGYMSLWNVNLDAISMITIIMSIGFSVDFAAHITYGYVSADELTPEGKIINALERLGWPVFQGALSTILGILVLGLVDSYMVKVFFKNVLLVIVLGMVHALVFLPVLLSHIMPHVSRLGRCLLSKLRRPSPPPSSQSSAVD